MLLAATAFVILALFARADRRMGTGISVWLAFTATLGASGVLSNFDARPPRLMLVVLPALVGAVVLGRRMRVPSAAWPIAIQTMRVPIELALFSLWKAGDIPVQMTFEGRNFDILVGLTAPFLAWAVARGKASRAVVVAWNVLGLGLLANIVIIAVTSVPGPLHLDWPGPPNTIVATFPSVWLPAFLVPVALFGHVASLRAGRRAARPRVSITPGS